MKKENLLTTLILSGLVLGVLAGQFWLFPMDPIARSSFIMGFQNAGEILFMRPLMMLIVPLVFASVVTGVTSIGEPRKLGIMGGAAAAYFIGTTFLAVVLGLTLVNVIQPGEGVSIEQLQTSAQADFETGVKGKLEGRPEDIGGTFMNLLRQLVPDNPLRSAVERDMLGIVVFAILIGLALVTTGQVARPVITFFEGLFAALIKLVMWVIWLAPFGVFCIVAARVGELGLAQLVGPMGKYMLTVILGLAIHLFIFLPIVLALFGRTNPYKFLWSMRKVIVTALSTSSSNATLPITIEECQRAGCSKRATNFVVPLGSTVNMNGTALYEAVAVSFLFQMFNYDLTLSQQFLILITATLAAVGAAGIPAAGLVTMAIVIGAVNSSLQSLDPTIKPLPIWTIGIIFGVDRILDMCRTVVNVLSDCIGARILTRLAPDDPRSDSPPTIVQ